MFSWSYSHAGISCNIYDTDIDELLLFIPEWRTESLPTIASELEEEEADIKPIYDAVVASAPNYDIEEIKTKLNIQDTEQCWKIDSGIAFFAIIKSCAKLHQ